MGRHGEKAGSPGSVLKTVDLWQFTEGLSDCFHHIPVIIAVQGKDLELHHRNRSFFLFIFEIIA